MVFRGRGDCFFYYKNLLKIFINTIEIMCTSADHFKTSNIE